MSPKAGHRRRLLTWHVHGNYLLYLSQIPHDVFVPVRSGRPEGYGGRSGSLPWPDNLHEVAAEDVAHMSLDGVIFQSRRNYLHDRFEILSGPQRNLPRIYIEHDPPREHPTDSRHPADDPELLLVHVTAFNALMWDSGRSATRVIDHGVMVAGDAGYTGERRRGLCIVNDIKKRGRRLGYDLFLEAARTLPLDLVGLGSEACGGLGEVPHAELASFASHYRFLFNPIRYTSLGLSVCEAMTIGLPVVGLATTEMAVTIENGVSGYVCTDFRQCLERMQALLDDHGLALRLSAGARAYAQRRFALSRFIADWECALEHAESLVGGGALATRTGS